MVPHLDIQGLECLKTNLSKSSNYLEYGAGGSTILADTYPLKNIISVDSDESWAKNVSNILQNSNKSISINFCDIGPVGKWGIPVNNNGYKNYWKYTVLPWEIAKEKNCKPDLILIDGRFRVATFLYSYINSSLGTNILFDDYIDRSEYWIVEKFCSPMSMHGRMALFQINEKYNVDAVDYLLRYSVQHE